MRNIEFFWDPASPYTYLASTRIEALAARVDTQLRWRPFLLGAVFRTTGVTSPASVPTKARYVRHDVALWARQYGVALTFPTVFPVRSVLALRLACALQGSGDDARFAKAVMHAYWTADRDIAQPDVLTQVCSELGLDGAQLVAQAGQAPAKDALRRNTDEAVRRGVFGAPTFFVGNEMFWGNDRLSLLEAVLDGSLGREPGQ